MKLVKESFGDNHYDKALECVRVLREEAIKVSSLLTLQRRLSCMYQ